MSMFQEGAFDVMEFMIPAAGMNQNISPKMLPSQYAYVLENIIPVPLGRGSIRYGTRLVNSSLAVDSTIMKIFPFLKNNGFEQLILYVSDFVLDISLDMMAFTINAVNNLSFNTLIPGFYQKDSQVKIVYSGANFGNTTTYCNIDNVVIDGNNVTLTLGGNFFPSPIEELTVVSISYSVGNIYSYDTETETLSAALNADPMSVTCVPRSVTFQSTLIICNGVDRLVAWDGTTLSIVTDYVKENANAFNRIGNNSFSFVVNPDEFDISKYPVDGKIRLTVNDVPTDLVVQSAVIVDTIVTIVTTTNDVPVFTGEDSIFLFYADYPPPFNFLFVAHQRIWALGPGAVSIDYRDQGEALKFYYTNQVDSYTAWFDEGTKLVGFEDISGRQGIADNLEAICSISNYTVFIGRHKSQVWQGTDPTTNAAPQNSFSWSYNLNIGIAHGNLLVELSNDTYIVTDNGIVSLSRFNITQQIGATDSNMVDPIVRDYLQTIKTSNAVYRICDAFKYKNGPFCGFKIGNNKILTSLYSINLYSWMFFSGDFANALPISGGAIDSLYLGIGNAIYKYADGKDGAVPLYGDNDGTALIPFFWTLPVVHQKGARFANKRYEIQVEYGSAFARNNTNSLYIGVVGDLRKSFELRNLYALPPIGDAFNTAPLLLTSTDPNMPEPTDPGMRLDIPYDYIKGRLKFVSSSFWLYIMGYSIDGPVYFDRIRLFGTQERRS